MSNHQRTRRRRRGAALAAIGALTCASALWSAAPAYAAGATSVEVVRTPAGSPGVFVKAAAGTTNDLTIVQTGSAANAFVDVTDTAGVTSSSLECTVTGTTAHCQVAGLLQVRVFAGDRADTVTYSGTDVIARIDGEDGDDTMSGGADPERLVLSGGPGNDVLTGTGTNGVSLNGDAGDDTLNGGAGDDGLRGGSGNDALNGGAGVDTADYFDHTADVIVLLSRGRGGAAGETDTIDGQVENVTGGSGNDRLVGDDGPNVIAGAGGDDEIFGLGGNDHLNGGLDGVIVTGGDGDDTIDGGFGADDIIGGDATSADEDTVSYAFRTADLTVSLDNVAGDGAAGEGDNVRDTIEDVVAGNGNDTVTGSSKANRLTGDDGADTLQGNGGNDVLSGGAGFDSLNGGGGVLDICALGADGAQTFSCEVVVP
jgi:Ca2+-binding RTX toxin-like protein